MRSPRHEVVVQHEVELLIRQPRAQLAVPVHVERREFRDVFGVDWCVGLHAQGKVEQLPTDLHVLFLHALQGQLVKILGPEAGDELPCHRQRQQIEPGAAPADLQRPVHLAGEQAALDEPVHGLEQ